MATFSVEIADEDVNRVIEALCVNYNRPENINGLPNPEDKFIFANRMVREFLSDHVKKYELDKLKQNLQNNITPPNILDPQQ